MNYIAIYHTHKFVITLFILIYFIKTILIISGKDKLLDSFISKTKIIEWVVSGLFLLTGIVLLFEAAEIRFLLVLKIIVVLLSIPIAIVAYKKRIKLLAIIPFLMLCGAYGMAEMNKYKIVHRQDLPESVIVDASDSNYDMVAHGKALYNTQCVLCHGENGELQMSGAKNLTQSKMILDQVVERVQKGKLTMPPYEDDFSSHEIDAISEYVMTLR